MVAHVADPRCQRQEVCQGYVVRLYLKIRGWGRVMLPWFSVLLQFVI